MRVSAGESRSERRRLKKMGGPRAREREREGDRERERVMLWFRLRNRDAWKGFRLHSGIRSQKKERINGWMGDGTLRWCVCAGARALRGRLWMRINLHSDRQHLFNKTSRKCRNNDSRTSSLLRQVRSFQVLTPSFGFTLIYTGGAGFWSCSQTGPINLHHPPGTVRCCLSN